MNGLNIDIEFSNKAKHTILEVRPGNVVKVIAPEGHSQLDIQKVVSKKLKWIIEKQRQIKDVPVPRKREFVSGESFPVLGKEYRLKVVEGRGEVGIVDDRLVVAVPRDEEDQAELVKLALVRWYKETALSKIKERVPYFAEKIHVTPAKISIKDYTGRWGSCTPAGELIFNWQIITLPRSLFDYVIAHEVAHLKEMNHSIEFKRVLKGLIGEIEELEVKLCYSVGLFSDYKFIQN